jgi:Flp pilus assembly protein TadB
MGARPLDFLLADPIGRALCCAGVLLDVAGVFWIRAVVRRVERA